MNEKSTSELTARQTVIKNKFKTAFANRLEIERDVNQAMNPLTAISTECKNKNVTLPYQSNRDPNALCDKIRAILARETDQNITDINSMDQIDTILDDLRELGIII